MGFFAEVRLQSSAVCRAWTAEAGCRSAAEWETAREALPFPRAELERARLRISEALGVEGIDPLGFARKLLVHESAAPLSRAGLREAGFVHLEAASGIHLYALGRAYELALARVAERAGWGLGWTTFLRTAVPFALWFGVFGLTGFRPGLWRPLALVVARFAAARFGIRWRRAAPILLALGFDAVLGFFAAFGSERTFAEWAPGELHYAAAWWGGVLGYEWARARGYGAFRAHLALSVASWISVLPLDFADGRFAPATPILSWLTVEFLARGGYLALFVLSALVGLGAAGWATETLQWSVAVLSRGLRVVWEAVVALGGLRTLPEGLGTALAVGTLVGLALWAGSPRKPGFNAKRHQ